MSSKKKSKGKRSTSDAGSQQQSKTASSNGGDAAEEGGGEGGAGVEGRAGGLKAFVQRMEGSSHRVVEMRLALVGAFGVAFRLLLFDDLTGKEQTSSSVLCFVVGECMCACVRASPDLLPLIFSLPLCQLG